MVKTGWGVYSRPPPHHYLQIRKFFADGGVPIEEKHVKGGGLLYCCSNRKKIRYGGLLYCCFNRKKTR